MAITAENVAKEFNISRSQQDEFAAESQKKTKTAIDEDAFDQEIVSVEVKSRKGSVVIVSKDEHPKPETNEESLARLRPAFIKENGSVTAGNASGLNDGAAAVMVMSLNEASRRGLQAMAKIVSWASTGVNPSIMGIGPVSAVRKAVDKAGWTLEEVDLFELNEAFAAQSLAVVKELGVPAEKVNVCGGAIALGHPIGASGRPFFCSRSPSKFRIKENIEIKPCIFFNIIWTTSITNCEMFYEVKKFGKLAHKKLRRAYLSTARR